MVKSWKEENWRGRLKILVFSLTPVTILVLMAEGMTALAVHRSFGIVKDEISGRQTYVFHMGRYPWSHTSRTPLNSLGFPDEEFVNIRPKGACTHVVFVGDSYTFGDGVDREDSYSSLVRSWSARRFPDRCLRFFNLGDRATTIEQQARHLDDTWDLLQPDIVILGQYQNDLTDLTKRGFAGHVEAGQAQTGAATADRNWSPPKVRIPLVGASIVKWLSYHSFAIMSQRGIHYDVLSRWSVLADSSNEKLAERLTKQYRELFSAMLTRVRARGASLGVVIIPSKFDVLAGRSPEEGFFVKLAAANGVAALPLFETFDAARFPYPYLMYDGHLNRHGNSIVARAVMSWLYDGQPAPFAQLRSTGPSIAGAEPAAARPTTTAGQVAGSPPR
jgi:hypothetical protein